MKLEITPNYTDGYNITIGKVYKGIIKEGIFSDSPYILFLDDKNKKSTAHLSRFKILTKCPECDIPLNQNLITGEVACEKCNTILDFNSFEGEALC